MAKITGSPDTPKRWATRLRIFYPEDLTMHPAVPERVVKELGEIGSIATLDPGKPDVSLSIPVEGRHFSEATDESYRLTRHILDFIGLPYGSVAEHTMIDRELNRETVLTQQVSPIRELP